MTRPPCEVSWFSALCDDDYEFLGVSDPLLKSSWEHCRDIVLQAEAGGFDNILLPSGYELGIDTTAFAAAIAPQLKRMRLLMAVRIGEMWPPQLARQIATIDRLLEGRLTVNIVAVSVKPSKSGEEYGPDAGQTRVTAIPDRRRWVSPLPRPRGSATRRGP